MFECQVRLEGENAGVKISFHERPHLNEKVVGGGLLPEGDFQIIEVIHDPSQQNHFAVTVVVRRLTYK